MAQDLRKATHELISFVERALRTTDDPTVEEDGQAWQVRKNPNAGVAVTLHEVVDGKPTGARATKFIAAQERHADHPEDIPFVAGQPTYLRQDGEDVLVVWVRDRESTEREFGGWPPPALTDEQRSGLESPFMQSLSERIHPIAERLRGGDPEAKGEFVRVMTELRAEHPDELAELQSVTQSVFQGPEAMESLAERIDSVVAECVHSGWHAGEQWESDVPFPQRGVRLERGNRVREIRATIFGPGQWLLLRDAAA